jgi:hypothetical protein
VEIAVHSAHSPRPRPQVKSYHQQRHLLVQFLLTELLRAHTQASTIKTLFQTYQNAAPLEMLEPIIAHITQLVGSTHKYMRLFDSSDYGLLTKIKHHVNLLYQHAGLAQKEELLMHRELNHAVMITLKLLDVAKQARFDQEIDFILLEESIEKVVRSLKRFSRLTVKTIRLFRRDENVLFFLLKQQQALNTLFGEHFVAKVFKKMFTHGLPEGERFILKRYRDRGFEYLLPVIHSRFTELATP